MLRRIACGLSLAVVLALAAGCGNTTVTTLTPTTTPTTDTFSGLLHAQSTNVFSFLVNAGGSVTATLTAVGPDATQTIGFSLGTFDAATNTCTVVFDNTAALQAAVFNTQSSTAGTYCVRLYDNGSVSTAVANGTATAFTFTVTVSHL